MTPPCSRSPVSPLDASVSPPTPPFSASHWRCRSRAPSTSSAVPPPSARRPCSPGWGRVDTRPKTRLAKGAPRPPEGPYASQRLHGPDVCPRRSWPAPPAARSAPRSAGGGTRSRDGPGTMTAPTWRSPSAAPSGPWPPASSVRPAAGPATASSSRSSTRRHLDGPAFGPSTPTSPRRAGVSGRVSESGSVSPSGRAAGSPDATASRPGRTSTSRSATPRAERSTRPPSWPRQHPTSARTNGVGKLCFRPDENP